MSRAALALALLALAPSVARAGPWLPGRYHFYLQLRESVEIADQRYDATGDLAPIRAVVDGAGPRTAAYRELLTDLFAEVGLSARLSLLADFQALSAIFQPLDGLPARSHAGVSDLWLAAKLLLFDEEVTATLLAGISIPIGDAASAIPLGQGDVRADVQILVGKLFPRRDLFVDAMLGVRLRGSAEVADPQAFASPGRTTTAAYSNELRFAAAGGYSWLARRRALSSLIAQLKLEGAYAFDRAPDDGLGLLVPRAASYVKLGPELAWTPVRGVQIVLGGSYFVWGRGLPALGEVALALAVSR